MPRTDNVFALGPTRDAGRFVSPVIPSTLVPSESLVKARGNSPIVSAIEAKWGDVDTILAGKITPDAATDSKVLFDIELQMSDRAAPTDESWVTIASAIGMPAFATARDGSLVSPLVTWSSTKVTARFLRMIVTVSDSARWGASIEVA